jgi:hypothetical protein
LAANFIFHNTLVAHLDLPGPLLGHSRQPKTILSSADCMLTAFLFD